MRIVKAGVEHRDLLVLRFHRLRLYPFSVSLWPKEGTQGEGGREGGRTLSYLYGGQPRDDRLLHKGRQDNACLNDKHKPKTTPIGRKGECVSLVFAGWRGMFVLFPWKRALVSLFEERCIFTFLRVLARPRCNGHAREEGCYQPCFEDFCVYV